MVLPNDDVFAELNVFFEIFLLFLHFSCLRAKSGTGLRINEQPFFLVLMSTVLRDSTLFCAVCVGAVLRGVTLNSLWKPALTKNEWYYMTRYLISLIDGAVSLYHERLWEINIQRPVSARSTQNELLHTTKYSISPPDGAASSYRERLPRFGTTVVNITSSQSQMLGIGFCTFWTGILKLFKYLFSNLTFSRLWRDVFKCNSVKLSILQADPIFLGQY